MGPNTISIQVQTTNLNLMEEGLLINMCITFGTSREWNGMIPLWPDFLSEPFKESHLIGFELFHLGPSNLGPGWSLGSRTRFYEDDIEIICSQ